MAERRPKTPKVPYVDPAPAADVSAPANPPVALEPALSTEILAPPASAFAAATETVEQEVAEAVAEAPVPVNPTVSVPAVVEAASETIAPALPAKLPDPAALAAPYLKGFIKMATAPEMTYATADKFQSMFGDVNERAKTAVEKTSKMAEDFTELTKGNVEAFVASGRVAAKGAEAMTQEVAEYSKKSFETATATFKSFAAVKSPTELFQLQSEFAKTSFDSMFAEASKVSESMLKLMGEIAQPLSSRYAVAAEKFKASTSL